MQPEPSRPRRKRRSHLRQFEGLVYITPALALVVVFFMIPLGMTAWMSLHDWPLLGRARFVGLKNYVRLWSDSGFWQSLWFTVQYTVVATVSLMAIGLGLAFMVQGSRRGTAIYRTVYFMPVVTGFASAALLWAWMANVDSGVFSRVAEMAGLTEGRVNILGGYGPAFWLVMVMVVWKVAGFYMVILMSGLQAVPTDYIEAARIDGAGPLQRFRYILAPLMRQPFALALILCVSGSMLAFDQFYIILSGGPQNQTVTVVYNIFLESFVSFRLGYGAALSMVLLVILLALSVVQLELLRDRGDRK